MNGQLKQSLRTGLARAVIAGALIACGGVIAPQPANATPALWQSEPVPIRIVRQPLTQTIRDLAEHLGVAADIYGDVDGTVVSPPAGMTANEMLDWLAREFDLVWFFDGVVLHITGADEAGAALVDLQGVPRKNVLDHLDSMSLRDDRFIARSERDVGMLMVGGPPAYRQIVERVVGLLASRTAQPPTVFRGAVNEQR